MKILRLSVASLALLAAFLHPRPAAATAIPVNYRAGRYVGTLQIITSDANDPFLRTSATIKLRGRSDGNKRLRMIGTPQHAMPAAALTDDFPMKVFVLEEGAAPPPGAVFLTEPVAMDTEGSGGSKRSIDSQTVTANAVTARLTYQRDFGGVTFDVQIVIKLRRIGP